MKTRSGLSVWAPKPPKVTSNKKKTTTKDEHVKRTATQEAAADTGALQLSTTGQEPDQPEQAEREFTLFPKLPPELRNKIWQLNVPGPRIVKVVHDPKDMASIEVEELESGPNPFWRARVDAGPVPVLLHVNKEARSFMRKHYHLYFDAETQGRPIYFDFHRDTLYFAKPEAIRAFYGQRMERRYKKTERDLEHMDRTEHTVRRLAFGYAIHHSSTATEQILTRFTNLDHLSLMAPYSYSWAKQASAAVEQHLIDHWTKTGRKVPSFEYLKYFDFKLRFS